MKLKLLIILSLILILPSCKKAELKKPTSIDVKFSTKTTDNSSEIIELKDAELTLQDFTIKGKRIEGEDINFTRHLESPININLKSEAFIEQLYFDIPQGKYTELTIEFNNFSIDDAPSLLFYNKYKLTDGPTVHVVFEVYQEQLFSINCEYNNQSDLITLDKKVDRNISIELNPEYWFEEITNNELDNAILTIGNNGDALGNSTILINQENNILLYNKIVERITEGNKAIFN